MRILLTNDDGWSAEGLRALHAALSRRHEVIIAAPEHQQSGASHKLTIDRPLRARRLPERRGWRIDGTPADCVKLALSTLIREPVDWVISGINQGSNAGILAHYSGTVAAAKEGAISGCRSMAVSLCGYRDLDYRPAAEQAAALLGRPEIQQLGPRTLVNVNVPPVPAERLRGLRIAAMNSRALEDAYDERIDPRGEAYYWLSGTTRVPCGPEPDDLTAIEAGYVAVTPFRLDWACPDQLEALRSLEHDAAPATVPSQTPGEARETTEEPCPET